MKSPPIAILLTFVVATQLIAETTAPLGTYTAVERRHWSFQPRQVPVVPVFTASGDKLWVKNPIDAFILARLQKEGMKPAPEAEPGYSVGTFAKATQEKFLEEYRKKYPQGAKPAAPEPVKFAPERGYDAHQEHHRVFYEAIRAKKKPVEDAVFGFRAAGPALLANISYFEKRVVLWDPVAMTMKKG